MDRVQKTIINLLVVLVLVLAVLGAVSLVDIALGPEVVAIKRYIVLDGDTLYDIYVTEMVPVTWRVYRDDISLYNDIEVGYLSIGETIFLPLY